MDELWWLKLVRIAPSVCFCNLAFTFGYGKACVVSFALNNCFYFLHLVHLGDPTLTDQQPRSSEDFGRAMAMDPDPSLRPNSMVSQNDSDSAFIHSLQ